MMNLPATAKLILPAPIVCSFCDHDQHQTAHIIVGKPGIAICDDCVGVCVRTIIDKTRIDRGLPVVEGAR